jgi:hypothetical protein
MATEHKAHFVITGEFLTHHSRVLWLEGRPEAGLRILEVAFPDMPAEVRVAVSMGLKKLEGDSDVGITVEDDEPEMLPSELVDSVLAPYRKKMDKLEDEVQFFAGQTVSIPSPHGLIKVPERRTRWNEKFGGRQRILDGDWDLLERIPWKRVFTEDTDGYFGRQTEPPPEPKPEPPPPPKPSRPPAESRISCDDGWLSPTGQFYRCPYGGHINLIDLLLPDDPEVFNKSEQAEKLGWMKIQEGKAWNVAVYAAGMHTIEVSQKQRDMIFDWYTERGKKLPYWMGGPDDD